MLSRRSLRLLLTALVVLFASVFLFGESAHAETIQITSPLRQNEPVLQQVNKQVAFKKTVLNGTTNEVQQLIQKKQDLTTQLDSIKQEVDELNQKVADKKAAAEAEQKRVEELRNMFVHVNRYAGDSSGNLYAPGNCTWYAKSRRADLPNSLGNANTWYSRAKAMGWSVGTAPKKGAVATSTSGSLGHVAYVEGVSSDGLSVTISEMNRNGLYSMNTRTVHYTEFRYIYELN